MSLTKLVASIIGLLTLFGFLFGAYQFFDNRYALSEEVKKVEKRLDYKILSDQYNAIQQREWTIQDRYQGKPVPQTTSEELRNLDQKKSEIKGKMDTLEKGVGQP